MSRAGAEPGELLSILNTYVVQNASKRHDQRFWPRSALLACLTPDRVRQALLAHEYEERRAVALASKICHDGVDGKSSYLQVFAILVLCEEIEAIEAFLGTATGFSDESLPLRTITQNNGKPKVVRHHDGNHAPSLPCFRGWGPARLDSFLQTQWHVCPYVFQRGPGDVARHDKLEPSRILPWVPTDPEEDLDAPKPEPAQGAFGMVNSYKVHPDCQRLSEILQKLNLRDAYFAVKTLRKENIISTEKFQHEADQLRRFDGKAHRHLVTLLSTYQQNDKHYFVFPYAECDLQDLWEKNKGPRLGSVAAVQWISTQMHGLMAALSRIHNPGNLASEKFGRHGDIKPDNILCYKMRNNDDRLLVLTDLGLSALNSKDSRSNIPGDKIQAAPGYRPPECDVKEGFVSRLFDVWTMGCLFLDALTYSLGGQPLREEFEKKRTTKNITGGHLDPFYETYLYSDDQATQCVKPQVLEWIESLRHHSDSTKFVNDVLDIIENEMLVILSVQKTRFSSDTLAQKFKEIEKKCFERGHEDYCIRPVQAISPRRPVEPVQVAVVLTKEILIQARTASKLEAEYVDPANRRRQLQRSIDFRRLAAKEGMGGESFLQVAATIKSSTFDDTSAARET